MTNKTTIGAIEVRLAELETENSDLRRQLTTAKSIDTLLHRRDERIVLNGEVWALTNWDGPLALKVFSLDGHYLRTVCSMSYMATKPVTDAKTIELGLAALSILTESPMDDWSPLPVDKETSDNLTPKQRHALWAGEWFAMNRNKLSGKKMGLNGDQVVDPDIDHYLNERERTFSFRVWEENWLKSHEGYSLTDIPESLRANSAPQSYGVNGV